jgi:formiminoglutamase
MEDPLASFRATPDPRDPRAGSLLRGPLDTPSGEWALLGLPYDGGIPSRPGARHGPTALRRVLAGFGTCHGDRDLEPITDLGDLALPPMNGAAVHARIEAAAQRSFASFPRVAFLGGDHGCTGSVLRGLAAARPHLRLAVVSIDAHLDVREYEDPASLSSGTPFRRALETPILTGDRVAVLGLRPFANSSYYLGWARERGIHLFTVDDVDRRGARAVAAEALALVAADADAIYLSVDLDAADSSVAPGVSAAGVAGLSAREMVALVATVCADRRLVGLDLMELSPPHDLDDRTARLAGRLLLEGLYTATRPDGRGVDRRT